MKDEFDGLIQAAGEKYGVPFDWIKAVIGTESGFDPWAFRPEPQIGDGSYGLMQVLSRTAAGLGFDGSVDDLFDPATNIDLGTKLLAQLRRRFGDDFAAVYSAYNSGSGTAYQTSPQVAAHVTRAVDWLSRIASAAGAGVKKTPIS